MLRLSLTSTRYQNGLVKNHSTWNTPWRRMEKRTWIRLDCNTGSVLQDKEQSDGDSNKHSKKQSWT